MPNVAYPVAETEVGIAIETTKGAYQAPVFWIPTKTPKYKPDLKLLDDDTLQGSMVKVYDKVPSLRFDSHAWDGYPYLDTFPLFLRCLLGSSDTLTAAPANTTLAAQANPGATTISTVATVASGSWIVIGSGATLETHRTSGVSGAGPFTVTLDPLTGPLLYTQASANAVTGLTKHQFSLLNNQASTGNQPPGVSITDFDGEEWRGLTASQLDTLTIKGTADTLDGYSVSWMANASTTPSTPTPSFTTAQAPPGWTLVVAIGGTVKQYLVDWELSFKRGVKPIPAFTGTQQYFMLFANVLEATGKITVIEQSGAPELTAFEAGTTKSLDFSLYDIKNGWAVNLHSTNAKFTTAELDRSKEWVEVPLEVQLLPSAADALAGGVSPVLASVANAQTTSY